jgi:hypothetical protein
VNNISNISNLEDLFKQLVSEAAIGNPGSEAVTAFSNLLGSMKMEVSYSHCVLPLKRYLKMMNFQKK